MERTKAIWNQYQGPVVLMVYELKNSKPSSLVNLVFTIKIWLPALLKLDCGVAWNHTQADNPVLTQTPVFTCGIKAQGGQNGPFQQARGEIKIKYRRGGDVTRGERNQ